MNKSYLLRKGRVSVANHYYALTFVCHNRANHLNNFFVNRQIIHQMRQLETEGLINSNTFVLMPNHMHWLIQLSDVYSLSEFVRRFKGRTASIFRKFNQQRLWQKGFYDHQIRDEGDLLSNARYIIANPLRAGLVKDIACYPFWDSTFMK
ncbi:MAG: transposase [Pseudomonadota bacterium]